MQRIQGLLNVLNKTLTSDNLKAVGRFLLKAVKAITLKRHHPPNDQPTPGSRLGKLKQERQASIRKAGLSIQKPYIPRRERAVAATCKLLENSASDDPAHATEFLHQLQTLLLNEVGYRGDKPTADRYLVILKEWLTTAELPTEKGRAFLTAIESGQGIGKAFSAITATVFLDKEGKQNPNNSLSYELTDKTKQWTALTDTLIVAILETFITEEDEANKIRDAYWNTRDPDPAYLNRVVDACKKEGG